MYSQAKKLNRLSLSPSSTIEGSQGFFSCSYPDCNYKSNWEEDVGRHERIHNPTASWNIHCEVCPQKFAFLVSFFYHMFSQHSNKLFCPWCLFLGEDFDDFKSHMLAHIFKPLKSGRHKTTKVTHEFSCVKTNQPKFLEDIRQNSIANSKCKKQTGTPKKTHRPSASPSANVPHDQIQTEEIFRCSYPECNYKSIWKENVSRHEKDHNYALNCNLSCEICPEKFLSLSSFFHHMSSQHPNKLFCPLCPFLARELTEFNFHVLAHSFIQHASDAPSKSNPKKEPKLLICAQSCRMKPEKPKLTLDTETNRDGQVLQGPLTKNRFPCGNCFKSFTFKGNLIRHQKNSASCTSKSCATVANENDRKKVTHDQRALLGCDKCSYKTSYVQNLRKHSRIHSSEKPFACRHIGCDYKAHWAKSVQKHQRRCRLPLPAETCEEISVAAVVDKKKSEGVTESRMKKVKGLNGEEDLLNCSVGSFRSKRKSGLKVHLMVHTDDKPFGCPVKGCKYRSKWSHNLKRHSSLVHLNKVSKAPLEIKKNLRGYENKTEGTTSSSIAFACMLCDFVGDTEMSAWKHAREHKTLVISLDRI